MTFEEPPHKSGHQRHPVGEAVDIEAEALAHPNEQLELPTADQMSLGRRLRQPRTILSLVVPLVVLVVAVVLFRSDLEKVPELIRKASLPLLLVGFCSYYLGFPLRGFRWQLLLRGSGYRVSVRDSTEIVFISWLVNCIVPAKLGDLYRAYLLKLNSPVSATKTLGTVFIERIFDLFAIAVLGLAAGLYRFRSDLATLPASVRGILIFGVIIVILLVVAVLALRAFGRRIITALPLPHRVVELYDRFEEGVFQSVGLRGFPLLGGLTALIWLSETFRLYFVVLALGFTGLHLGFSGVLFVALIGSLLTAIPLTPAGLGMVEFGTYGVLTAIFGVPSAEAAAIVLLDRAISVFSLVIIGTITYVISSKPRGAGMTVGVRPGTT